MKTVTLDYEGASITLPASAVVDNWLASIAPKASAANDSKIVIPQLGEYWHGQGGIYAARMRGNKGKPDRHVVIPVADVLNLKAEWGCRNKEIKGADNDLYGMPNTIAMAEAGSEVAKQVLSMEIEGHKDFYIGARHEYRAFYLNVPELFKTDDWYWTSTQYSATCAFLQYFRDGTQYSSSKNYSYVVRPVRSFVI